MPDEDEVSGELRHSRVDIMRVIKTSWNVFKNDAGTSILASLLIFGIAFGGGMLLGGVFAVVDLVKVFPDNTFGLFVKQFLFQGLQTFIGAYVTCLGTVLALYAFQRRRPIWSGAFDQTMKAYPRVFVFYLIIFLVTYPLTFPITWFANMAQQHSERIDFTMITYLLGYAVVLYPILIYVGLLFFLTIIFIIDRDTSVLTGIKLSLKYMNGNKVPVFLLGLLIFVISVLVAIFTCGIGFAIGFVLLYFMFFLGSVNIYLEATGRIGQAMPNAGSVTRQDEGPHSN